MERGYLYIPYIPYIFRTTRQQKMVIHQFPMPVYKLWILKPTSEREKTLKLQLMPRHWTFSCGTNLGVASDMPMGTVHGSEIWRSPPGMYRKTPVNNGINYQPQLVSLPDFWSINSRFLGRSKVLLFEPTKKNLPTIKDESPITKRYQEYSTQNLRSLTTMSSGRAFLDARKSFERYSVAPNCCLMLFPQDVRKFEKPQFSEQIWKSPLLLKIFRHNVAVVSAIGSNKISLESHTNTFQLVNSILPASQAKPINQNARVHISNSVFVLPKTSKNHRVFRKKQKNIWGVPKMVVLRFLKNDHFGVFWGYGYHHFRKQKHLSLPDKRAMLSSSFDNLNFWLQAAMISRSWGGFTMGEGIPMTDQQRGT